MRAAGKKTSVNSKCPRKLWPFRAATRAGQNAISTQTAIARIVQIHHPFAATTIYVNSLSWYEELPAGSARSGAAEDDGSSLAGHRDAKPFLRRDQVVGVLGVLPEVDPRPVDRAGEDAPLAGVVVAHGGGSVHSNVASLVPREDQGQGCLKASRARLV